MGSAGLEFDATDSPEKARLNQKTNFVGTGAQISTLTTYAGMTAFCTSTGSGFTADFVYIRNSANSAWITQFYDTIQETSEDNSTPITDNADFTVTAGTRYYAFLTIPSTYKFYEITGIEWKNGATVAGNVICGIDLVNANPPTIASTPLACLGVQIAQSGTSVVQRNSLITNGTFRAGSIIGVWVSCSSGTATLRENKQVSVHKIRVRLQHILQHLALVTLQHGQQQQPENISRCIIGVIIDGFWWYRVGNSR